MANNSVQNGHKKNVGKSSESFIKRISSLAVLTVLFLQNLLFAVPINAQTAVSGSIDVVISQVYGAGGNSGAVYQNDYVELFNRGTSSVSLSGLTVQYASATGAGSFSANPVVALNGSIDPGQYYLVKLASGGANGSPLPTENASGTINMAATAGKVILVNGASGLACNGSSTPCNAAQTSQIIDLVGFGSANYFETAPAPAPSAANSIFRASGGCVDNNNNSTDFSAASASPRNLSSALNSCGFGTPTPTPTATPTPTPTATPTPTPTPVATNPTGTGSANPSSVMPTDSTLLTVNVTPGQNPVSTSIVVTANLSSIGGSAAQTFIDNGNNSFSFQANVASGTTAGVKSLPFTVTDAENRTSGGAISLTVEQPTVSVDHLVISQIYGGGGNTGATYQNDYVQLYNPTPTSFNLAGWTLQYASVTGSGWNLTKQPLGGTIAPSEYYLIKLASGGAVGAELPEANISGGINMSGTNGKIALVNNSQGLTGINAACPLEDPNLVDLVGYGTANCFEGTQAAVAMSSTTALFRKNGGISDTNNNRNDFSIGTPNPVRTTPIKELGPWVAGSDPFETASNQPRDGSFTIDFSEPVDLDANWININCSVTGNHNDATMTTTNSAKTFVVTPNRNFQAGEQCTATVLKDTVHDQDLDDSEPDTDTLTQDYISVFTIANGTLPPYEPSVHLTMGNPSDALADTNFPNNYLMEKPELAISYNREKGTPNWVSWHLDSLWVGSLSRVDTFRPDPAIPSDWYRVQAFDYFASGFDRGHMTPNADRNYENSIPINQATFLMTNMIPQAPDNNQGPWAQMESELRSLLGGNELYIVSGPAGNGGTGSNGGITNTIADGKITVPAYTWKVVIVLPKGDNDLSRVTAATRTIAVIMPNTQGIRSVAWQNYLTTVDNVEALTGYDFFSNVPVEIQASIEAGVNGNNPPGVSDRSAMTSEDTALPITLTAVNDNQNQLNFVVVTQPSSGTLSGTGANLTYTPNDDYNGADSFTYKAVDGSETSNTATVSITITSVNDAPIANSDDKSTDEDTDLVFSASDLTVNDSKGAANESDEILMVTQVNSTVNTNGTVVLSNGQITYQPNANFNGAASFEYQVCDNGKTNGVSDVKCAIGTVNVFVNSVNDAPTLASIANQTVVLGDTLTLTVLGSDVDIPAQTLVYSLVGNVPTGATINAMTGEFSWTPTGNQFGQVYAITVRVTDSGELFSQQSFTVTIQDNTAPQITISNPTQGANYSLNQTVAANYSCSDANGSGIQSCTGTVASGAAIDTSTVGTKSFIVTATDRAGNQSSQTVTYTVGYKVVALFDQTKANNAESTISIIIKIVDANGVNLSSANLQLTAIRVDPGNLPALSPGNSNPNNLFIFDSNSQSYQYNLKSDKLWIAGTHQLIFRVAGDSTEYAVSFNIR